MTGGGSGVGDVLVIDDHDVRPDVRIAARLGVLLTVPQPLVEQVVEIGRAHV